MPIVHAINPQIHEPPSSCTCGAKYRYYNRQQRREYDLNLPNSEHHQYAFHKDDCQFAVAIAPTLNGATTPQVLG